MENSLIIRQAKEHEYEEMLNIQWDVLFKPYGEEKNEAWERLSEKDNDFYSFVALIDSNIEGAARLQRLNETEGKIKYMAIKKESEISRIGPSIVNFIEWYARGLKLDKLLVEVREIYVSVLEKCNYERKGKEKAKMGKEKTVSWEKEL